MGRGEVVTRCRRQGFLLSSIALHRFSRPCPARPPCRPVNERVTEIEIDSIRCSAPTARCSLNPRRSRRSRPPCPLRARVPLRTRRSTIDNSGACLPPPPPRSSVHWAARAPPRTTARMLTRRQVVGLDGSGSARERLAPVCRRERDRRFDAQEPRATRSVVLPHSCLWFPFARTDAGMNRDRKVHHHGSAPRFGRGRGEQFLP